MTIEPISHYSLKKHNSFGLDVKARYWQEADSVLQVQQALEFARKSQLPVLVLGGGSNLVLTSDFPGLVIKIAIVGKERLAEDAERVTLRIGAGENWHALVLWALDQHLYGIENLVLIPGTVGAAPIQNIGAYGVELERCFIELEALDRDTGKVKRFSKSDCAFGYRDSVFKRSGLDRYIITHVTLELQKTAQLVTHYRDVREELTPQGLDALTPAKLAQIISGIRQRKLPQPEQLGNAGSFFKNPVVTRTHFERLQQKHPDIVGHPDGEGIKLAAAWLIDRCGWKGYREGDAGVHGQQALVLVNYGKANGQDILALATKIQNSVAETFGVTLEIEPRVYG